MYNNIFSYHKKNFKKINKIEIKISYVLNLLDYFYSINQH